MKSVPLAALTLALMATSAMAQPRLSHDQDQQDGGPQQRPARAEQPRQQERAAAPQAQPQAAQPPQAQFQRSEGRREREAVTAPQAQPQAVQPPQAQFQRSEGRREREPVSAQPQAVPTDRRDFPGRRQELQAVSPPVAQPRPAEVPRAREQAIPGPSRAEPQAQGAQSAQRAGGWQADRRQLQGDPRNQDRSQDRIRDRGQQPQSQPQPQAQSQPSPQQRSGRDDRGRDNRQGGADRSRDVNGWNRDGGRGGWDQNHRGPQDRPNWARADGRRDRDRDRPRYDFNRYPRFFEFQQRYRAPLYARPYGYYDYQWGYGDSLPWGWYGPSYWIEDWYAFGLPIPPVGCEWVRVGRDALLIDTFDGRVLSVARLLFW